MAEASDEDMLLGTPSCEVGEEEEEVMLIPTQKIEIVSLGESVDRKEGWEVVVFKDSTSVVSETKSGWYHGQHGGEIGPGWICRYGLRCVAVQREKGPTEDVPSRTPSFHCPSKFSRALYNLCATDPRACRVSCTNCVMEVGS